MGKKKLTAGLSFKELAWRTRQREPKATRHSGERVLEENLHQWRNGKARGKVGDFSTSPRVLFICLLALLIGVIGACGALVLLRLIALCTNLFFFQRWSFQGVSPADNHLGLWVILVPVLGGLINGLLARYGSERIRGHGIPEALEAILFHGSRIQPRVALLKPFSAAISIGSGGPFGAEGPIILTGGACGSITAQFFELSSAERKTLLVAGAAAGMSATFAAPVGAVLLAVEILLFEWKPRSLIPVAIASVTAAGIRTVLFGQGPLFPVAVPSLALGPAVLGGCVIAGLLAGGVGVLLSKAVYAAEDAFERLPFHWMWWPALGGLVVGLGGFIFPQALGVGYNTIDDLLRGNLAPSIILSILLIKPIIWSVSLGSGTSGGVLAPLLLMGGALGGLEAGILPHVGLGFWPLISMAAILGGALRSPLTATIFVVELSHGTNALLPLLLASTMAYGLSVLIMPRSILTEKVSRRGYHLTLEYAPDPLEVLFVRDVMRRTVVALLGELRGEALMQSLRNAYEQDDQHLYPVLDGQQELIGVLTRRDLHRLVRGEEQSELDQGSLEQVMRSNPVICYPDEPLRVVVSRMVETKVTRLPVVQRHRPYQVLGMISLNTLLKARVRNLQEEFTRQRILGLSSFVSRQQNGQQEEAEA